MAVYTHVAAEELAAFLAGYDLGDLLAAKGIAEGVSNSNYLLDTTGAASSSPSTKPAQTRPTSPGLSTS
jgi:homoserine kinase type II